MKQKGDETALPWGSLAKTSSVWDSGEKSGPHARMGGVGLANKLIPKHWSDENSSNMSANQQEVRKRDSGTVEESSSCDKAVVLHKGVRKLQCCHLYWSGFELCTQSKVFLETSYIKIKKIQHKWMSSLFFMKQSYTSLKLFFYHRGYINRVSTESRKSNVMLSHSISMLRGNTLMYFILSVY